MVSYRHRVQYYETDKMGITHHSNYIRWMEEGRTNYLEMMGCPYEKFEQMGLISPVLSIRCDYKQSTTYGDDVDISVGVKEYNGFRIKFEYTVTNVQSGQVVFTAESDHCFLSREGGIVRFKRAYPELHEKILSWVENRD